MLKAAQLGQARKSWCSYPETTDASQSNTGRKLIFEALRATLDELFGREGVTEVLFRESWLDKLRERTNLSLNGWYSPPPKGVSVLFGTDGSPERLTFRSLRQPKFWPNKSAMDWSRGLLYAYCSLVDVQTGLPGDFGLTLYFGNDPAIRAHFTNSYEATRTVLSFIQLDSTSFRVFCDAERVFKEAGLRNSVVSVTDAVQLDLGHSLPVVPPATFGGRRVLTKSLCDSISKARRFINGASDWPLRSTGQVTIEPQLVCLSNPLLPQLSFHYVVSFGNSLRVFDECDQLFRVFGLAA